MLFFRVYSEVYDIIVYIWMIPRIIDQRQTSQRTEASAAGSLCSYCTWLWEWWCLMSLLITATFLLNTGHKWGETAMPDKRAKREANDCGNPITKIMLATCLLLFNSTLSNQVSFDRRKIMIEGAILLYRTC